MHQILSSIFIVSFQNAIVGRWMMLWNCSRETLIYWPRNGRWVGGSVWVIYFRWKMSEFIFTGKNNGSVFNLRDRNATVQNTVVHHSFHILLNKQSSCLHFFILFNSTRIITPPYQLHYILCSCVQTPNEYSNSKSYFVNATAVSLLL